MSDSNLMTIRQIVALPKYSWLSEHALRHLIFEARSRFSSSGKEIPGNGLQEAGVIIRIGRKILIDLNRFDEWVLSHRSSS